MLSRFTARGLTVRIVDKRSGNLDNGTRFSRTGRGIRNLTLPFFTQAKLMD